MDVLQLCIREVSSPRHKLGMIRTVKLSLLSSFKSPHLVHQAHLTSIANGKDDADGNDHPVHDIQDGVAGSVLLRKLDEEDESKDGVEEASNDPLTNANNLYKYNNAYKYK